MKRKAIELDDYLNNKTIDEIITLIADSIEQRQYDEAIEHSKSALNLYPNYEPIMYNQALAYWYKEEYQACFDTCLLITSQKNATEKSYLLGAVVSHKLLNLSRLEEFDLHAIIQKIRYFTLIADGLQINHNLSSMMIQKHRLLIGEADSELYYYNLMQKVMQNAALGLNIKAHYKESFRKIIYTTQKLIENINITALEKEDELKTCCAFINTVNYLKTFPKLFLDYLVKQGLFEEAIELSKTVFKLYPNYEPIIIEAVTNLLARLRDKISTSMSDFIKQKLYNKAIELSKTAFKLYPNYEPIMYNQALAYWYKEEYQACFDTCLLITSQKNATEKSYLLRAVVSHNLLNQSRLEEFDISAITQKIRYFTFIATGLHINYNISSTMIQEYELQIDDLDAKLYYSNTVQKVREDAALGSSDIKAQYKEGLRRIIYTTQKLIENINIMALKNEDELTRCCAFINIVGHLETFPKIFSIYYTDTLSYKQQNQRFYDNPNLFDSKLFSFLQQDIQGLKSFARKFAYDPLLSRSLIPYLALLYPKVRPEYFFIPLVIFEQIKEVEMTADAKSTENTSISSQGNSFQMELSKILQLLAYYPDNNRDNMADNKATQMLQCTEAYEENTTSVKSCHHSWQLKTFTEDIPHNINADALTKLPKKYTTSVKPCNKSWQSQVLKENINPNISEPQYSGRTS